jgi:poly(3-hydroxybutyrate) depolymerase
MVHFAKNFWSILALCLVATHAVALDVTGSITSGGISRSFVFHAPGTAVAGNLPLVIIMHGDGGTGSGIKSYSGFDAVSNTSNFIAVYPNAANGAWNRYVDDQPGDAGLGNPNAPDDIAFISDLITYFCSTYQINAQKVYATGHSAGGYMAYHLAFRLPNRIAAFAPVAASVWGVSTYINSLYTNNYVKVPIMHIHGDTDPTVTYPDPNHAPNAWQEWPLNNFSNFNCGSNTYTSTVDIITGIKKLIFCPAGTGLKEVSLIRIVGGNHGWPNVAGWNTAQKIWEFFNGYSLSGVAACTAVVNPVAIQVNTTMDRKPISPLIYGLNPYHYDATLTGMAVNETGTGVTALRFGGDAVSTYNWEKNVNTSWNSSCCATYSSNDNNRFLAYSSGQPSGAFGNKAGAPLKLVSDANSLSAYSLVQISAAQYVAKDFSGCIRNPNCGSANTAGRLDQVIIQKPSALSLTPDLSDGFIYADEEVNYLISQAGLSSTGGVKGYCLENEPGIWHNTHPLNHPIKATCAEVISKNSSLAKRIKTLDPQAETFGPGMFGFSEYTHLNSQGAWGNPNYYPADWNTYNMSNVVGFNAANYNYMTWVCSYLRQMKIASDSEGKRLLDGLDIHFYNQGNNVYQDSRSFWDPTYVENSWITNDVIGGQPLHLVHYLQKAINSYYPDTKLAITEWGNFTNYNLDAAGIYTADLLGAFGKNNVYMGNYFGRLMGFTAGAFKIFRNYNGTNGRFGNTSVQTTSSDNSKITVYSAIQDANETKLNLVMINRSGTPEEVAITLTAGTGISYKTAEVFAMEAGNAGQIIQKDGISTISQNQITYTLPSHSVYHLVFDASEPLPVTLTSFTGEMYENNSVLLKWKTTSEIHADIFEIERADNGKDFEAIRTEKSSGGESGADYQYVDRELSSGTYYYRLKSIDLDKSFAFSKIVSVRVEATDELHIAPSPTQTSFKITNLEGEPPYKIQVYEKTGKLVLNDNVMKRDQEINIEKLKSGIYIVKINDRQVRKLIISR